MASRNAEIAVGVTVIVALGVVIWSVTALKQVRLREATRHWKVAFSDVGGLAEDDPVSVNGVKKGSVKAIELAPGGRVIVDFILAKDVRLKDADRVFIRNVGMMGEKFIAIAPAPAGRPLDAERDTIVGVYESGIPEVVSQMGDALASLERLSDQFDRLLQIAEERNTVRTSLANVEAASLELRKTIAESHQDLVALANNLRATSEIARRTAETNEPKVARALDDVSRTSVRVDSLIARLDDLSGELADVSRKINSGEGTTAKLINEHELYDDTRTTLKELTALVRDLRSNPKKYFKVSVF
jgi:phospholipid/cholesterol/gamma-HCH transport system substrate-binding protein